MSTLAFKGEKGKPTTVPITNYFTAEFPFDEWEEEREGLKY